MQFVVQSISYPATHFRRIRNHMTKSRGSLGNEQYISCHYTAMRHRGLNCRNRRLMVDPLNALPERIHQIRRLDQVPPVPCGS